MNAKIEPLTFTVPLALTAHAQAEQFRRHQSNPGKAKQVYLNTLAVYAVNVYLQFLGFETDLSNSASWNPAMQALMDIADLEVKNCGYLECRFVLPDAEVVSVPVEVWSERIGYVAVRLNESLREAMLLGFAAKVTGSEIPLEQLRSLEDLPEYLSQLRQPEPAQEPVKLSQWFEKIFEAGWQAVEELFTPQQPALSFRCANPIEADQPENSVASVSRVKLLDIGSQRSNEPVALMVELIPKAEREIDLSVKVFAISSQAHLPQGLKVMVLDETGIALMQAQVRNTETIQLKFSGEPGERFSIRVNLDDITNSVAFII